MSVECRDLNTDISLKFEIIVICIYSYADDTVLVNTIKNQLDAVDYDSDYSVKIGISCAKHKEAKVKWKLNMLLIHCEVINTNMGNVSFDTINVDNHNYFGVVLDKHLTLKKHFDKNKFFILVT